MNSIEADIACAEELLNSGEAEKCIKILAENVLPIIREDCSKAAQLKTCRQILSKAELGVAQVALCKSDFPAAYRHVSRSLGYNHKLANSWGLLGDVFERKGEYDLASAFFQVSINLDHTSVARNNLGAMYIALNDYQAALPCFLGELTVRPKSTAALTNLATVLFALGDFDAAKKYAEMSLALNPCLNTTLLILSSIYRNFGLPEQALEYAQKALLMDPYDFRCAEGVFFTGNYCKLELFSRCKIWGKQMSQIVRPKSQWPNVADPTKRLLIGFLSGDFGCHPVSRFVRACLAHTNLKNFHTVLYSNRSAEDEESAELKSLCGTWRYVFGVPVRPLCDIITQDQVDILVDLSGHTSGNRLDVMLHKPAPVQVAWIGFPNTTGLPTIDYRITDAIADPLDSKQQYTEKLVRMPDSFLCYTPLRNCPDVTDLPAGLKGHVTFGCLAYTLAKVNRDVIAAWCKIMSLVPKSVFMLKLRAKSEEVHLRYLSYFAEYGIAAERIILLTGKLSNVEHLQTYGFIDIALDTFPYCGTTTTCEALFMGVPVVTLRSNPPHSIHAQNVSASLIHCMPELNDLLVADSIEKFVEMGVSLATDVARLTNIRANLRSWMTKSPLCDGEKFTSNLEVLFRDMWIKWCEQQKPKTLALQ